VHESRQIFIRNPRKILASSGE